MTMTNLPPLSPPSDWIMQQAKNWPIGATILDFAAGSGRHCCALDPAFSGQFSFVAIDRDYAALAALKARCPQIKIYQFDLEDTNNWGFTDGGFDIVIVANYLYRPGLDDLFGLIRQDGYLAYETFATGNEAFGRPSNPDFLLQDGELAARLPDDFTILDYFHGRIDQPKPAIIQRLAAKRQAKNRQASIGIAHDKY